MESLERLIGIFCDEDVKKLTRNSMEEFLSSPHHCCLEKSKVCSFIIAAYVMEFCAHKKAIQTYLIIISEPGRMSGELMS